MKEMRRVLITGVDGFLGTHLSRALIKQGDRVSGLIRPGLGILNPDDRIDYHEGDLLNKDVMERVLAACDPDVIYHLAAQTFVPRSFSDPRETYDINFTGTANLLEAVRKLDIDPVVFFSSSSEEYGLVYSSGDQYQRVKERYSSYPPPLEIPELPVGEGNPLRPLSPYGLSKTLGTSLMASYHSLYGIKTLTARSFNIEGPGRGEHFVTSHIITQVLNDDSGEIRIGNVNIFKDWSHVEDVISGFRLIVEKGRFGQVYNVGSERTNSILTFILLAMKEHGHEVRSIRSIENAKMLNRPLEKVRINIFGRDIAGYRVDEAMLGGLRFDLEDVGILVSTGTGDLRIIFDEKYFRPHDNPVIMCDAARVRELGYLPARSLEDIVAGQMKHLGDRNIS